MLKAFEKKESLANGLSDFEDDDDIIDELSGRDPLDHFDDSDFEQEDDSESEDNDSDGDESGN